MKTSKLSQSTTSPSTLSHNYSSSAPLKIKIRSWVRKNATHRSQRLNFSHSESSSTGTSQILTTLRARHTSRISRPDPALAAEVVSNYLIPLFEADTQLHSEVARSLAYGTKRGTLDPMPGTVFGELKLSEQLGRELTTLRVDLAETQARLRESEQRKASAISESQTLQLTLNSCQSDLSTLRLHSLQDQRRLLDHSLIETQLAQELKTLRESYEEQEEAVKRSNALLQDQYAVIDKLRNRVVEQEHINSLLLMENDIVGERLKGLYFAIQHIADSHFMEQRYAAETTLIADNVKQLLAFADDMQNQVRLALIDRDLVRVDNTELVAMRNEMKAERDRIAKITKEKITDLMAALQRSEDERTRLQTKFEEAEKNFKDLTEEYEKMRQKAKQYRMRKRQFGEEEEKICKNCQKVFVDSENYNWSCRRHPNEYSGDIYWCCGKSNRDAIGCRISKHESKEEEEGEIAADPSKQNTQQCSVTLTQSCKKFGHTATDCPKDPNLRSTHDVYDELSRITTITSAKRKGGDQLESSQALDLMVEKNGGLLFNLAESRSESRNSLSLLEESIEERRPDFDDILKIKQEVSFRAHETLHSIEDPAQVDLPPGPLSRQRTRQFADTSSTSLRRGFTKSFSQAPK